MFFVIVFFLGLTGCEGRTVTISFDANGGNAITPMEVQTDEEELILPTPSRSGYAFVGWYGSPTDASPYDESTVPESDISLYAKWMAVDQHTIYYYDNNLDFSVVTGDFEDYVIGPMDEFHTLTRIYTDFGPISFTTDWTNVMDFAADETVTEMYFGDTFTVVMTSEGRIFTFGDNYHGELGDGSEYASIQPTEITGNFDLASEETIAMLAVGGMHGILLTTDNRVFTWGYNSHGQLGNGTLINSNLPIDITDNFDLASGETIIKVYAVDNRSFAITSEHKVFVWGNNEKGELGDNSLYSQQLPENITAYFGLAGEEYIDDLVLGGIHSMAVSSAGKIFAWGNNYHGQLGDGTGVRKLVPTDITLQFDFAAGEQVQQLVTAKGVYAHNLLLTTTGRLFVWGFNLHGQLGKGSTDDGLAPMEITANFALDESETIVWIGAINMRSAALTSEGRIFNWGFNQSGQLADGTDEDKLLPEDITGMFSLSEGDEIESIQMGVLHTILTTTYQRIFAWGEEQIESSESEDPAYMLTPTDIGSAFYGFNTLLSADTAYYLETLDLNQPTKSGYVFAGWYQDKERSIPLTDLIMPDKDLILYAKWIPE